MILGIDPGLHGALALLDDAGRLVHVWDMPSVKEARRSTIPAPLLDNVMGEITRSVVGYDMPQAVLEKVGSMPGQGVTSMFNFGCSVGLIRGFLSAYGMTVTEVAPNIWKARMGLTGKAKDASRTKAIELYPAHAELFKLKKHEGRAEATLIAAWGHQNPTRLNQC